MAAKLPTNIATHGTHACSVVCLCYMNILMVTIKTTRIYKYQNSQIFYFFICLFFFSSFWYEQLSVVLWWRLCLSVSLKSKQVSSISDMLVFLAISHQIIPTVAPLLWLHDPITFQDVREEDGGKSTPPTSTSLSLSLHLPTFSSPSQPTAGFLFHAMGNKSQQRVQSSREEKHERIFWRTVSQCKNDARPNINGTVTWFNSFHIFQLQCASFTRGKSERGFHLCAACASLEKPQLCLLSRTPNLTFTFLWWHWASSPPPKPVTPNPCHPTNPVPSFWGTGSIRSETNKS